MGIQVLAERDLRVPPEVEKTLIRYGGLNRFGKPNWRFVWGWRRGDWILGSWQPRYGEFERWLERFHLERWCPPEFYGAPEFWYEKAYQLVGDEYVNVLGEFPVEGDYERVGNPYEEWFTKQMIWPTIDLAIEHLRRNEWDRARTKSDVARAVASRMERQKRLTDERKDAILEENEAAFALKQWMPVSGPMTAEKRRRADYEA